MTTATRRTRAVPKKTTLVSEVRIITPDQALEWLTDPKYKGPNRHLRESKVDQYADDMSSGRWMVTGEAIKFDKKGFLLDGQHRLHACVKSGTSFETVVICGLDHEVQNVMDTGATRRAADVLSLNQFENYTALAAAARIIVAHKKGQLSERQTPSATNAEILAFAQEHPRLQEITTATVNRLGSLSNHRTAVIAAIYLIDERDQSGAQLFLERLGSGAGLDATSPILALREKLISIRTKSERYPPGTIVSMVMRCFIAWQKGHQMTRVMTNSRVDGKPIPIPVLK